MSQQGRPHDTSPSGQPGIEVKKRSVDPLKESLEELSRIADDLIDQITIDETIGEGDAVAASGESPGSLKETLDELDRLVEEEPKKKRPEVQVKGDKGTDIDERLDSLLRAEEDVAECVAEQAQPAGEPDVELVVEANRVTDETVELEIEAEPARTDDVEAIALDEEPPTVGSDEPARAAGAGRGRTEIRLFDDLEDGATETEETQSHTAAAEEHVLETAPEPGTFVPEPETHLPEVAEGEPEEALAEFAEEAPAETTVTAELTPAYLSETGGGRKKWWWLAAAVVIIVVGGGLVAMLNRGPASDARQDAFVPGPPRVVQETPKTTSNPGGDKTSAGWQSQEKVSESSAQAKPADEKDIRLGSPRNEGPADRSGTVSGGMRPEASSTKTSTATGATRVAPVTPLRPKTQAPETAKPETGTARSTSSAVTRDTATTPPPRVTSPKATPTRTTQPKATTKKIAAPSSTPPEAATTKTLPPKTTSTGATTPKTTPMATASTTKTKPRATVVNQAPKEVAPPSFESATPRATKPASPRTTGAAAAVARPVPAEPVTRPPQLLSRTEPSIPAKLKKKFGGSVVLKVLVNEKGRVVRVVVDQGVDSPEIQAAAIDAVLRSTYQPATENGKPVRAWASERFSFDD